MAMIFLIGAVVGLYWVKNPKTKLGILSGLTVAFAGTLALFTNARRQDVFAATAAYAAVLVVFISGNLTTEKFENPSSAPSLVPTPPLPSTVTFTSRITTTLFSLTAQTIVVTTRIPTTSSESPAPTSTNISPSSASSGGLSTGAKAGIGVGAAFGAVFLLAIPVYVWRRKVSGKPLSPYEDSRNVPATLRATLSPELPHRQYPELGSDQREPRPLSYAIA